MALNITVHDPLSLANGAMPQAPRLNDSTAAQVVALGAQSTVITGPALLCLLPDEDQRVSAARAAGYVAPASTGIKLKAGVERWVTIAAGGWYINAVAG